MANDVTPWSTEATKSGTYKFNTAGKFVDRDIHLVIPKAEETVSGEVSVSITELTPGTKSEGAYPISGTGTGTGTVTATVGTPGFTDSISYSGAVTGSATATGSLPAIQLTAEGSGTATVTKVQIGTKSGNSYPITDSEAGSGTGTATASVKNSGYGTNETGTGTVTVTAKLNSSISSASATVSGTASVKPNKVTASNGNASVSSNSTSTSVPSTGYYIGVTPYTASSTTITQSTTLTTPGYLGDSSEISAQGSVSGGSGSKYYVSLQSAEVTKGTTIVGTTKGSDGNYPVTRGVFDISEGYIGSSAGDLNAALFNNSATDGITYKDISETSASPILVQGSGLYINQGYVDNLYISLAKLTPDGASAASAIQAGMLNDVSAYDNDGNLITGNIVTKSKSDVTVSGSTVTVPNGYYASDVSKSVASGSVNSFSIDEITQSDKVLTAGTLTSGYYPITVPSLSGTVSRTEGYISGTSSSTTDANGGVVGKIVASSISKTDGTATANANTTHNLVSGTYTTSATTGYTYHVDATANASTTSASITAGVGYVGTETSASTSAASSGQKSSSIYIKDGLITNNTSGGTSTATITSGKQIKIAKGYYTEDVYYTAQVFSQQAITGSLFSSITSGYNTPTLVDSMQSGVPYVTLSGNGSMTTGNQYNGTANAKTQYMEVYTGTYSIA